MWGVVGAIGWTWLSHPGPGLSFLPFYGDSFSYKATLKNTIISPVQLIICFTVYMQNYYYFTKTNVNFIPGALGKTEVPPIPPSNSTPFPSITVRLLLWHMSPNDLCQNPQNLFNPHLCNMVWLLFKSISLLSPQLVSFCFLLCNLLSSSMLMFLSGYLIYLSTPHSVCKIYLLCFKYTTSMDRQIRDSGPGLS